MFAYKVYFSLLQAIFKLQGSFYLSMTYQADLAYSMSVV